MGFNQGGPILEAVWPNLYELLPNRPEARERIYAALIYALEQADADTLDEAIMNYDEDEVDPVLLRVLEVRGHLFPMEEW